MTVRAGIIGLGRWGKVLIDSVADEPALKFKAAVSRTPLSIKPYCDDRNMQVFDSLDEMLADGNINALVIATPHGQHFDQIMKAVKAGTHVFCEKPFTLCAGDANTALTAITDAGLVVGIGHNRRFAPNSIALKSDIEGGKIGKPIHIDGFFNADLSGGAGNWRNNREESPAGGMTSLGIHVIDAFIHIIGRIKSVRTNSLQTTLPMDIDDNTHVDLEFENGCTGRLTTIAATAMLWRLSVFGDAGWAEAEGLDSYRFTPISGKPETVSYEGFAYPAPQTIAAGLTAFAGAIESGPAFPITPEEIGHATAVLDAIIRSAETNQKVMIN